MIIVCLLLITLLIYIYIYYPKQICSHNPKRIDVHTPNDKVNYHDDCLHPCIRKMDNSMCVMVQSPWYNFNDVTENPIMYMSKDRMKWHHGIELQPSPQCGYNSDPNVFVEGNRIYVFWREYATPQCKQLGVSCATFGKYTDDEGKTFSPIKLYIANDSIDFEHDKEMCPILLKHLDKYYFYATWYQFQPEKKNLGIAIWEGSSLECPDFRLKELVPIKSFTLCDKWKQKKICNHIWFIPIPHRFDLWHFDLFVYKRDLYMVACEDKTDNIVLYRSKDFVHFTPFRKPLMNAHYMENFVGYRQKYYKPTALVEGDIIHLYYTSNDKDDYKHNILWQVDFSMNGHASFGNA